MSEDALDRVLDEVHTLNDETPKIRTDGRAGVSPDLVFNLDSKLASSTLNDAELSGDDGAHNDEVGTCTVWRGAPPPHAHAHDDASCQKCAPRTHVHDEEALEPVTQTALEAALAPLPKDSIYRVKGFIRLDDDDRVYILNWAFGRFDLTPLTPNANTSVLPNEGQVRLTVMGHPGEVKRYGAGFARALGSQVW